MPIACSSSTLTGQDGLVMFSPAGTTWCLQDHSDFKAGNTITVPAGHDFRVGDTIMFHEEDGGQVDSALAPDAVFYVVTAGATSIGISDTLGGSAIALAGDGGTGTADSAGHINVEYSPIDALCGVKAWSMDLSRESLDTTTLPCKVGGGASRYATFRTSQAGFASGEGSMTVAFTKGRGQSNRLLANSMFKNSLAKVKLYVDAVEGSNGSLDDNNSSYIEALVSLNGFSVKVDTDNAVEAEIKFSLAAQPTALFGVVL